MNYCTNNGCKPCPQPETGCPCEEQLHRVLQLLCSPRLQPLVNAAGFAVVSGYYLLGSSVGALTVGTAPSDNLAAPTGVFTCGNGCSTMAVSGPLYAPLGGEPVESTVSLASLCSVKAVVFEAAATETATQAENFQTLRQLLIQCLNPNQPEAFCRRGGSLLESLTTAAQQTVSLAVGPLLLENAAVLGELGSVMVLANSTDSRFYLICANAIDFIG